ncbi:BatA domain-containing protein [Hymenobacter sp. BT683]|uniref:BatA domain-containing protein n=1 Tax=Hymenobacter jeongseonensis TaxID=2791027 RepID=A0ABS0IGL6_9BACT|nr:BatA domain-containing protein [Hymenobacter jeongseonensis]MBF9237312.1 BatA domain-containing protein [Hymenobacter jeongseonensis]
MFTLLTPSALLALLGLLVPVAIHLWNRRPGREIAVGSLRWLAAGANRRLRNLKPEQLWLLLLRASLLAVLAVVLAGPVWRQVQPAGRGQVLVSPELIGTSALAASRPTIDSLRRRGYALRWLAPDFPKMSRAALRADSLGQQDSAQVLAAVNKTGAAHLWARVQQASQSFPSQPLYVLTPAALRGFRGIQPRLPATVTWQVLPTGASDTWLQAAAQRGDSLRLLVGQSSESQTAFRTTSVARPRPGGVVRLAGLPPFELVTSTAGDQLRPLTPTADSATNKVRTVAIRSQPIRITIYATPAYAADARYLQAGLRAAAAGLLAPLVLTTTTSAPGAVTPPDWLFWLSDAPLPAAWNTAVSQGTQVWQEASGPGVAAPARLAVVSADEVPATVFRRSAAPNVSTDSSFSLWTDGLGRAVLSRLAQGRGAHYYLATHLNPAWSDLADNPSLPARLLALLQPEITDENAPARLTLDEALASHDQRALDPAQLKLVGPVPTANAVAPTTSGSRQTDLRPWLVLAALLLFAIERLLAHRRAAQALSVTAS